MQKECKCGNTLSIQLRTVKYSKKVHIKNVPIFSCEKCEESEVLLDVKEDLTELIQKIHTYSKNQIFFNEINEFAHLLFVSSEKELIHIPIEDIIEQRINELLDILLLAQSLDDIKWVKETEKRLLQITDQIISNEKIYKI
ncbi:YgiT-type zinc finger protein [Chengkuizengella sediminis]|uniref:YgiT-type zinc finger protein n=1 Tax=Chengkuizengella sediminis TaxID=1885917 RepID=UPI00138A2EC4|nr:YgiT-type zinc finger protein [Chengkuizengella sediminis]NDI33517.1 YgiT-type zinc finger protein [Chengkuizengella sediminis]